MGAFTRALVRSALFLLAFAPSAFGESVVVGNCMPNLQTYSTISQAVAGVSSGTTIFVCPGTYPEQVTITQPLTITGVQSNNAANPTIVVPSGGLTKNVLSPFNGLTVYFQILVKDTESGLVNIRNIAVDGNSNQVPGGAVLVGIYYQNASGVVSKVAAYRHLANRAGFGIAVVNTTSSGKSITVEKSSIRDFDGQGISIGSHTVPPLRVNIMSNAIITSNSLSGEPAAAGINVDVGTVTNVSRNLVVTHPQPQGISAGIGITVFSNAIVSDNTVESWGIWALGDSSIIRSNKVTLTDGGILVTGRDNVVQYNSILDIIRGGAAISFNCTGTDNTVIHNTINDAGVGIIDDHGGNTISPNSYSNVTQIISPPC